MLYLFILIILILSIKGFLDIYNIRNPKKIFTRNNKKIPDIQYSWIDAIKLTILYKWRLLGTDNIIINELIKNNTKKTYIKWTEEWTCDNYMLKLKEFAELKQIQINPWIWQKKRYKNADDFFSRKYILSYKHLPNIYFSKATDNTLHSPVECKIVAFNNIQIGQQFWIKNKKFTMEKTNIPNWWEYCGYPFSIFRLETNDYHRYHSPVSGTIIYFEKCENYDNIWSHSVKPIVLHNKHFNILNENRRRILIINTTYGKIALLFVGAVQIDSIQFNKNIKVGQHITLGQDMGSFHFGGSTIVMFTNTNKIKFDEDIINNSKNRNEFQIHCGEIIGKFII